ncbi:MAG: permease [Chthoniobacterales bacterium]
MIAAAWFTFNFNDFCYAFLSILLEGIPFMLLGTLISGLIDQFLPSRFMTKSLPKNPGAAIFLSGALGMIFPMCECGIVPVIRRLIGKGLPVSCAMGYMLAVPIVNPIVAVSTYMAFRGQGAMEMMVLRLGLGYLVAVLAAFVISRIPVQQVLRPELLAQLQKKPTDPKSASEVPVDALGMPKAPTLGKGSLITRLGGALGVAVNDFLDVCFYFVIGASVAAIFNTSVNQDFLLPFANNTILATASLMGLAAILSLCSTSDAFIAATLINFPAVAKLAFLVFGPMMDLKLLFIYSAAFKKRFVMGLAIGLFIVIGLICIRLSFLQL